MTIHDTQENTNAEHTVRSLVDGYDPALLHRLAGTVVLVKYGGNAMINEELQQAVIDDICLLQQLGVRPVIVHGGGPFIGEMLSAVGITSEFAGGHRITTAEAMLYVEMVLRGRVNGALVSLAGRRGMPAVGISGKDAAMVTARRRLHHETVEGKKREIDLGRVGDVVSVRPQLVLDLLDRQYLPVVAPVAAGDDGRDYNVNADMFAGHLAGALNAAAYIVLTDVDGLMKDKDDPSTLCRDITIDEVQKMVGSVVRGGMIPKIDSCVVALRTGAATARIVNGTRPHAILQELLSQHRSGTLIRH